jgi:anti-sigma B factor antagonist
MGHCINGTAASAAGPARQPPGTVRLAGMLTLSCLIGQAGQTTVTFAGELDYASAAPAYGYVRDVIDARGGRILLDVGGLSFCDAAGLGVFARMSRHAGQTGSSLHLVAPPPLLMKIIRMTCLEDVLPVHRADQGGKTQLGAVVPVAGHHRDHRRREPAGVPLP